MARVDQPRGARAFDFHNGSPEVPATETTPAVPAVASSIIKWSMATTPQWDDYERRNFMVFGVQVKGKKPTAEQTAQGAAITRDFCFSRIESVSGFEVDDGKGGVRELVWPDDKVAIIAVLVKNPDYSGHADLFIRKVIGAHRPQDESALEVDQGN